MLQRWRPCSDIGGKKFEAELPQIVVLSADGNDDDSTGSGASHTLEVGMVYDYAQALIQQGVKLVVVCQMVRRQRWRQLTMEEGKARVTDVN